MDNYTFLEAGKPIIIFDHAGQVKSVDGDMDRVSAIRALLMSINGVAGLDDDRVGAMARSVSALPEPPSE